MDNVNNSNKVNIAATGDPLKVGLIVGSLREGSINRKFANVIVSQLPQHIQLKEIKISDLPLYNQDYDERTIDSYDRVRGQIKEADAILIVTPEHNRSMPAALKNVIDIGSRPYQQSVWSHKKVALVTASPGSYGGINSGLDVRKSLQALSVQMMISPEMYLSRATQSFDEDGGVSEHTQKYLQKFVNALVTFVEDQYQYEKSGAKLDAKIGKNSTKAPAGDYND